MVRRGLITQSTCQVDMPLSRVTRGFSSRFERGGDFLFFEGSSWAESEKKKREFGRDRVKKRCWGEREEEKKEKEKDRVKAWKGSEWWKSHKIWQDRFHQLKKKKASWRSLSRVKKSTAQQLTKRINQVEEAQTGVYLESWKVEYLTWVKLNTTHHSNCGSELTSAIFLD